MFSRDGFSEVLLYNRDAQPTALEPDLAPENVISGPQRRLKNTWNF